MRVEVFGCKYQDPLVSYSVPQPDEFAPNFYLDDIYDGKKDEELGRLVGGLGLLTDGHYGDNVTLHDYGLKPCKSCSKPF